MTTPTTRKHPRTLAEAFGGAEYCNPVECPDGTLTNIEGLRARVDPDIAERDAVGAFVDRLLMRLAVYGALAFAAGALAVRFSA